VSETLVVTLVDLWDRGDLEFLFELRAHVDNFTGPFVALGSRAMKQRRRRPAISSRPLGSVAGHFTKEGGAKKSYRTRSEAQSAAQLAWTLNDVDLSSYRCEHCHQWHIGQRFRED
jgi:hypothetical protein